MAFYEIQMPQDLSLGAVGGGGWSTRVVTTDAGFEYRQQLWDRTRGHWHVGKNLQTPTQWANLIAFHRICLGRTNGFRFRDWSDYQDGGVGTVIYNSNGHLQLAKSYSFIDIFGAIAAPVNGSLSAGGGGSLTGAEYFVRSTYIAVNGGETVGAPETNLTISNDQVLGVASPAFALGVSGWNVYVSTSTGAETLQNSSPIALGTSWTEPYTGLISGAALPSESTATGTTTNYRLITKPVPSIAFQAGFPGPPYVVVDYTTGEIMGTDPTAVLGYLPWTGTFDVPCRFDTDDPEISMDLPLTGAGWRGIPIIEIRVSDP